MRLVRMYTGSDGETQFEDVDPDFRDDGPMGEVGELLSGQRVNLLLRRGTSFMPEFHAAHERMVMVWQEGEIDMISTNGSRASLSPGDVVLVEDLEAKGHVFRFREGSSRWAAFFVSLL